MPNQIQGKKINKADKAFMVASLTLERPKLKLASQIVKKNFRNKPYVVYLAEPKPKTAGLVEHFLIKPSN